MGLSLKFSNADIRSSSKAEPWLVRIFRTSVVKMKLWQITGSTLDASTVALWNVCTYQIRRHCSLSSSSLYLEKSSQVQSSWRRMLVENICSLYAVVVSFTKGAERRKAQEEHHNSILHEHTICAIRCMYYCTTMWFVMVNKVWNILLRFSLHITVWHFSMVIDSL